MPMRKHITRASEDLNKINAQGGIGEKPEAEQSKQATAGTALQNCDFEQLLENSNTIICQWILNMPTTHLFVPFHIFSTLSCLTKKVEYAVNAALMRHSDRMTVSQWQKWTYCRFYQYCKGVATETIKQNSLWQFHIFQKCHQQPDTQLYCWQAADFLVIRQLNILHVLRI